MRRRGIVLIISIVLAVVMVMFVGAALGLGPGNLASSRQTAQRGQAQHAAESGINYALCRLRIDPNWRGDLNAVTINQPDLYVVEDNGNVIGLVRAEDQSWAQFRLRFNYQDGATNAEGLPDPVLTIDHPYVSVNNLLGGAPAQVPRADGPGYSVTAASERPMTIPLWSVSLAVEGRAGSSQLSPADPNPATLPGASRVTLEAVYQVPDMGPQVKEAAAMAASNFQAILGRNGKLNVTAAKSGTTPRLRSKSGIGVTGGDEDAFNYVSPSGKVATASGFYAAYDSSAVTTETENPLDEFYTLTYDKVKKADPTKDTMPAGTYVWWDDGTLHYYDMGYEDYLTHIASVPDDAGSTPSLPGSINVSGSGSKKEIELTKSIYVEPTGSTSDLSIIPRGGAAESFPDDYVGGGGGSGMSRLPLGQLAYTPSLGHATMVGGFSDGLVDSSRIYGFSGGYGGYGSYGGYGGGTGYYGGGYPGGYGGYGSYGGNGYPSGGSYGGSGYPAGGSYGGTTGGYGGGSSTGTSTDTWVSTVTPNNGIIPLPTGVSDNLTANDLGIKFNGGGTQVLLSGDGNIRLTGSIDGKNGSITSGGELRITGLGAEFSAAETAEQGVNMYAKGDIVFSALDKDADGTYGYDNVNLKGVVYTWGNFVCDQGSPSSDSRGAFNLEGALVAYGGDPSGAPGSNGKGNILLSVATANLVFNPAYLGGLSSSLPAEFGLKVISWNQLP